MADTTITVNANGTADYLTLSAALAGEAAPIGVGNRLIFQCAGDPESIAGQDLAALGYDGTGRIVIRGDVVNPYIPHTGHALNFNAQTMFLTGGGPYLDFENIHITNDWTSGSKHLTQGPNGAGQYLGGSLINSRVEFSESSGLAFMFRNATTIDAAWDSIIEDSVILGSNVIAVLGNYAGGCQSSVDRCTIPSLEYLCNLDANAGTTATATDSALNLTGSSGYYIGSVAPTIDYCGTLDGAGTNPTTIANWDAQFVDAANGDFTLSPTSVLYESGSTGNNIGADQDSTSTAPTLTPTTGTPQDAAIQTFSINNLAGTISAATLAGHNILPLLSSTTIVDETTEITFTFDLQSTLAASPNPSEDMPRIGKPSSLSVTIGAETASVDIALQPKAGWAVVDVLGADASVPDSFAKSVEDALGVTVTDGDICYYDTSDNAAINELLQYSSDLNQAGEFTAYVYQQGGTNTTGATSYAAEFYPFGETEGVTATLTATGIPDGTYLVTLFDDSRPVTEIVYSGNATFASDAASVTLALTAGQQLYGVVRDGSDPSSEGTALKAVTA